MNYVTRRISLISFLDNINVLIYNTATENNCVILKLIYREYKK
jgi:hypothetical protein